ncbi:MAG: hypothetical protein ACR2GH_20500 [Pseudonocardia sp.]
MDGVAINGLLVDVGALPAVAGVAVPVQNPEPPPGRGEEFGKSSPVALVVIVLLALATIVLIRSMSKRIRRLPASFDPPADGGDAPAERAGPTT